MPEKVETIDGLVDHNEGLVRCPTCGRQFSQLGKHFASEPSHRPEISDDEYQVFAGLLMGDGCIVHPDQAKWPKLHVTMTSPRYLRHLKQTYPHLFSKIHKIDRPKKNHSTAYVVQSIPHPEFFEFKSWYRSGKKRFPRNIELSPKMVRHWYCGDGYLTWGGDNKTRGSACISSVNEDLGFLVDLFESAGFEASANGSKQLYFSRKETPRLLGWMGPPPAGFSYKWEWHDHQAYKAKKNRSVPSNEMLNNLSNQLISVAGELQHLTTHAAKERYGIERGEEVRAHYEEKIADLEEKHEAKIEQVRESAEKESFKDFRDKFIQNFLEHPEVDLSQRIIADCVGVSQSHISNVRNRYGASD